MSFSYDGYLTFGTKVDESGFEQGVSKMKHAAEFGAKTIAAGFTAALGAVTALSVASIKMGSDFEEGMSKVGAISGATGEDLAALTEKAKEMGAATKFSATESAEALQYMAMAGWKTEAMLDGLPGIMNLAAASGEDLGMVSDIVTDALTAFGLAAEDSAHFADVLAAASSNSNTNVGMMGYTFKYAAPLAGALGYTIEDTALAIGLMANAGIKSETAGTALRSMFSKMTGTIELTGKQLGKYAVDMEKADGSMVPLRETLITLRDAFSQMTESEKIANAESMVGREAMSGLLAIVNASEADYQKLTLAIQGADGAAADMAETMIDNLKGDMTILGSTAESVGIRIYEKFETPLRSATQAATSSLGEIMKSLSGGRLDESLDSIGKSVGSLLAKIAELAATGLPKLVSGFNFIVVNGGLLKVNLLSAAAAVVAFKAASVLGPVIQSWTMAAKVVKGYTLAMAANNAVTVTGKSIGILLASTMTAQQVILGALTGKVSLHTAATVLGTKAQVAFSAAIAANPVGAAAVAVAALAAGLVYLCSREDEATKRTKELTEQVERSRSSWEELENGTRERIQSQAAEIENTKAMTDELEGLIDAEGRVGENKARVQYLSEKINAILPDSVKWIDDETIAIEGNIEALKRQMELKQAKIALEEMEKDADGVRKARAESLQNMLALEEEIAAKEQEINQARADGAVGTAIALKEQLGTLEEEFAKERAAYESQNAFLDDMKNLSIAIQEENYEGVNQILAQRELQLKAAGDATDEELQKQIADTKAMYQLMVKNWGDGTSEAGKAHITQMKKLLDEYEAEMRERTPQIGQAMVDGVTGALQAGSGNIGAIFSTMLTQAVQQGKKAIESNSPSKLTARVLGAPMGEGVAVGFEQSAPTVYRALNRLTDTAITIGEGAVSAFRRLGALWGEETKEGIEEIKSPLGRSVMAISEEAIEKAKGKATSYKELGTLYLEYMKEGIDEKTEDAVEAMEKTVDKQTEAFAKKNKKAAPAYKKAAKELMDGYKETLKDGADEAYLLIKEHIEKITQEAQSQYDEIIRKQDSLREKLADYGDLFTVTPEGETQLADINSNIDELERYEKVLTELKEKGVSADFLAEVTAMGVDEGTSYGEALLALGDTAFAEYTTAWELQQTKAKEIAEKFYGEELKILKEEFTVEMDKALADIPDIAQGVGVDAMQGMIDGMESKRAEAVTKCRDIANDMIAELKRATETASPSKRAAREVGAPLTQGIVKGMRDAYSPNDMARFADKMMDDVSAAQTRAFQGTQIRSFTQKVSNITNHGGNTIVNVDKMINDGKGSVTSMAQELEFFRRQRTLATGGV